MSDEIREAMGDYIQTPVIDEFYDSEMQSGIPIEEPPAEDPNDWGIGGGSVVTRRTCPSKTNKYYITSKYGGLNECILGSPQYSEGSALNNCVGYAWGAAYEETGKRPTLSRGNAENWWGYKADGYTRSQEPRLGAVICWRKGKAGVASDGAGHVGIVVDIDWKNRTVKIGQSGYGGSKTFWLSTYKMNQYSHGAYIHQGFIWVAGDIGGPEVVTVNGTWGKGTTKYTQKMLGTTVDGIVSKQPRSNKKYLPAVSTASWEFKLFGKGSNMIKALQKLIGADPDGKFGKKSVAKFKTFLLKLGYKVSVGDKLEAIDVMSWQMYINAYFAKK